MLNKHLEINTNDHDSLVEGKNYLDLHCIKNISILLIMSFVSGIAFALQDHSKEGPINHANIAGMFNK